VIYEQPHNAEGTEEKKYKAIFQEKKAKDL